MALPSPVARLLKESAAYLEHCGVPSARLDAEVLLAFVTGIPRGLLLAHAKDVLAADTVERYAELLGRRGEAREPVQYLTGRQEFYSLEFLVDPSVLIPRPETELLVEELIRFRREEMESGRAVSLIADVATGSGCVAIAVVCNCPDVKVLATDLSYEALSVAAANARRHGVQGQVALVRADLLPPLRGRLDAILCNPPYVSTSDLAGLQREVRAHEPPLALVSGPTGLEVYERLVPIAAGLLREGGLLAMEIAAGRLDPVLDVLGAGPWQDIVVRDDFQRIPRAIAAKRSGASLRKEERQPPC